MAVRRTRPPQPLAPHGLTHELDRALNERLLEALRPCEQALEDLGLPPDPDGTSEGFAVLDAIMAMKPDTKVIVASGHFSDGVSRVHHGNRELKAESNVGTALKL